MTDDIDEKILKERIAKYSPEHLRLEKIDLLVRDDFLESLSDLSEEEINIICIFRALNEFWDGQLKATMKLIESKISLMRSRDRLGRQELVTVLKSRPRYTIVPYSSDDDENQTVKRGISRFLRFSRRSRY